MPPPRPPRARVVREPVQVYLAGDDSALLASLSAESGLSKAEVLRRGLRSYARNERGSGPMLRLLDAADGADWDGPLGPDVDAALGESYRGSRKPTVKRR